MALTQNRVLQVADAAVVIANELAAALAKADRFLEFNSDQAIDWAASETPAYIAEDADGNIEGRLFTRQQIANAIGSFDQFRKLMENVATSQGDHLGNVNAISQALPIR